MAITVNDSAGVVSLCTAIIAVETTELEAGTLTILTAIVLLVSRSVHRENGGSDTLIRCSDFGKTCRRIGRCTLCVPLLPRLKRLRERRGLKLCTSLSSSPTLGLYTVRTAVRVL